MEEREIEREQQGDVDVVGRPEWRWWIQMGWVDSPNRNERKKKNTRGGAR